MDTISKQYQVSSTHQHDRKTHKHDGKTHSDGHDGGGAPWES
ncbi:hypothetical protein [Streptomyces spiralis]